RGSCIGVIGTPEAERAARRTPWEGQNDVRSALGVGHVDEFERERARLSPLYRRALTGLRAGRKQNTGPRLPLHEPDDGGNPGSVAGAHVEQDRLAAASNNHVVGIGPGL